VLLAVCAQVAAEVVVFFADVSEGLSDGAVQLAQGPVNFIFELFLTVQDVVFDLLNNLFLHNDLELFNILVFG
jgi:hypothetical protein